MENYKMHNDVVEWEREPSQNSEALVPIIYLQITAKLHIRIQSLTLEVAWLSPEPFNAFNFEYEIKFDVSIVRRLINSLMARLFLSLSLWFTTL